MPLSLGFARSWLVVLFSVCHGSSSQEHGVTYDVRLSRQSVSLPCPLELLDGAGDRLLRYLLIGLHVHTNLLRLIRDGAVGGGERENGYLCPTTYSLHCHHQNDSALRRAAV